MMHSIDFYNYEMLSGIDRRLVKKWQPSKAQFRKDTQPISIEIPFDWSNESENDSNLKFQLHCWRMADKGLLEYFEVKDFEKLKSTFPIISDWYRFHFIEKKAHRTLGMTCQLE